MFYYQRLFGLNLMNTFLLCITFLPTFLSGQMTATIKYEYYSSSSNYFNRTEETQTNGFVSTKGSQLPVHNGQAFTLMDSSGKYDGCRKPQNTSKYSNGIAIILRGGDCTFSVKITYAKQQGASAVIIYDPQNDGISTYDMFQNNSDILALYVQRSIGSVLFELANDKHTYLNITLDPINNDYDDSSRNNSWYNSRGAVIFVVVSICILVSLFLSWCVFYYCQRYRSRTAKDHLQNRLTNAAKKALTKIPLVTLTQNPPTEQSCVICLDTVKAGDTVRQLMCGHTFHQTCVDPWLINHRHCPLCNLDILAAYGIPIPGSNNRRRSVVPENPPSISYASLATTAASSIQDQPQAVVNTNYRPIPSISGSIRTDIHDEQNSSFRSDNEH